jgi:hypothetical protein
MKNLRPLLSLFILVAALGVALWPDPPPKYATLKISALPAGKLDRIEIQGEAIDWQKLGPAGVKARLKEVIALLPEGRSPQIRIEIDDRQDWLEIQKLIGDVSRLDEDLELFFVKTLEGEIQ